MGSAMTGMGYDTMEMMADDMQATVDSHGTEMGTMETMDDAKNTEDKYQGDMADMMLAMEEHADGMNGSQMNCE